MQKQNVSWKNKYFLYSEASNFHNKVRDILLTGKFLNIQAFQEVPLIDIIPDLDRNYSLLRVDWYLPQLNVVIELNGKQHYVETNFGNSEKLLSIYNFIDIKNRDNYKKNILIQNDIFYIEIPYTDEKYLNEDYLLNKIKEA